MVSAFLSYNSIIRNTQRRLDAVSKEPIVQHETKYYLENAPKVKNVEDFLKNTRVFNYAMKAYGLEDMNYAKGLIRKVLTDEDFAKKMTDKRYATFREAFDFKAYGELTMAMPKAKKEAVEKYKRMTLEEEVGEQNAGARLALYFDRRINELKEAKEIKDSNWAYLLLGDKALAEVMRTALHLPSSIGTASVDAQKSLIETRMSIKDLTEPEARKKFIQRFLALYDAENEHQFSPAVSLLQSSTANLNKISPNTLSALTLLRPGR